MADIVSPNQVLPTNPPTPTSPPSIQTIPSQHKYGKIILSITLTILLAISLALNIAQSLGLSLDTFKFKKYQNLAISPENPNLIRYGMSYYLEANIKEVKNDGNNLELITDIEGLPKVYVEPKTNILNKNGNKFDITTKDQITPGRKVYLLLFNENMKEWFLSRIVLLPRS